MKPLKLKLENFGSYVDETINFTEFDEVPLFLISGKTGSGKTTIFDAMCFSLFGSTTDDDNRNGRTAEKLRSDFADAKELTRVTFWFEHQKKNYQVVREPKQDRHKTQKVNLFYEKNGQKKEITKITDANHFIEDLLGINAEQFRQIVLLPQGKFREFLESDSNNKNELLAELFGTQLYADWTQKMKDQLTTMQTASHDSQKQMEQLMMGITELADQKEPAQWLKTSAELMQQRQQALEKQTQDAKAAQAKAEKLNEQFHVEQNLQQAYNELAKNQAAKQELDQQLPMIQSQQYLIDELQWARQQQSEYDAWQLAQSTVLGLKNSLKQRKSQAERLDQQLQNLQKSSQALQAQQPLIDQINQQKIALENQLPRYQETAILKQQIQTEQQQLKHLTDEVQSAQTTTQQQTNQVDQLTRQAQKLQQQTDSRLIERQLEARNVSQKLLERLQTLQQHHQVIVKQQNSLQQAKMAQKQATQNYRAALTEFQTADQKHAALQIAELATHLKPGYPCPVCGSIEHPQPGNLVAQVSLDEIQAAGSALKQARQELDDAQAQLAKTQEKEYGLEEQLKDQVQDYTDELTQLKDASQLPDADFDQLTLELRQRAQTAEKDYAQTQMAIQELKTIQQQQQAEQQKLDQLTQRQQELDQTRQQQAAKMAELNGELTAKLKQLPNEFADLNAAQQQVQVWQNRLKKYQQQTEQTQAELQDYQKQAAAVQATIKRDQESLAEQLQRAQQLQETLQQALQNHDSKAEWSRFETDFKQLNQLESLQQTVNNYQQAIKVNLDRYQHLLKEINNRPRPQIAATQQALNKAAEQRDQKQRELGQLKEQFGQQQKTVHQVEELQKVHGDQQAELDRLADLVNTMNGKNNSNLSLERYVLRHYFKAVLENANRRLYDLTNGRYEFVLDDNSGSNTKWSGLEVSVRDGDVGKVRSVHTLSGGETFVASLAMALSLGEIIQQQAGGIQIDALFVDEGFGSLDPDALNKALNALQTLEGNSRMVGIISHVAELEERIPDQLKVSSKEGKSHVSYQHDFAVN